MRGRNPKPTQLKVIEGNRGKRGLNPAEPDPTYLNDLTPPAWLSDAAKDVWNEVAPKLRDARLLTEIDVDTLAFGCDAMAHYRQAAQRIGCDLVSAKLIESESGQAQYVGEHVNPWLIVQSMAFKKAMAVFQQFGMSPAARTRVAVNPQGNLFENGEGSQFFT